MDMAQALTQERDMVARNSHRPGLCHVLGATLLSVVLAGCSSSTPAAEEGTAPAKDPPGAALALSIGGRAAAEGEGIYDTSVNCAVALSITNERLAQIANNPDSPEVALLRRAERHFVTRAREAQASEEEAVATPEAAIAQRRMEKASATQEQAQLAIACLRRFGDDAG